MTRQEIKAQARAQLGGKIFGNYWMIALLVMLIIGALEAAAGSIIPGIGAIIITGPLAYGGCWMFLKQCRDGEKMNVGDVFCGFTTDFGQNFLIGLMTEIFTFLWGLLLIIPGIVKSYAYSMAYFIKADNPDWGWRECISASQELMRGHKWEKFVLDLSFLGWYIVGALLLGVGTLWVIPYHTAATAIFYENLVTPQLSDGAQGDSWYQE